MSSKKVGIVGLGLLGSALAHRLMNSGYHVIGYDVKKESRSNFQEQGGEVIESLSDFFRNRSNYTFSSRFLCL